MSNKSYTFSQSDAIDLRLAHYQLQGLTQEQMVEALQSDYAVTIDRSTLARRLTRLGKQAVALKAQHTEHVIAQLMWTMEQAAQAWLVSCQPSEITVTEQIQGAPGKEHVKVSVRRETTAGNPAFLAVMQKSTDQLAKLLGLNAPIQQHHTGLPVGPLEIVIVNDIDSPASSRAACSADTD